MSGTRRGLKVLLAVDPEIPVPPVHYGGIERIVHFLVEGLVRRGHEVQLMANPASRTSARLFPFKGLRSGRALDCLLNAWSMRSRVSSMRPDVVHNFARLAYMVPSFGLGRAYIQSYQRTITPSSVRLGEVLSGGGLIFTACSASCLRSAGIPPKRGRVIYNGVPLERFTFSGGVAGDAPLVFLGRVERIKGAHTAIRVAERSRRRLVIAGNHAESGEEAEYFKTQVLPHCDGRKVEYIGPVDDAAKERLLRGASALLFPIEWEEPFGIVMAEALACGTPVIGLRRGSVPEVLEHGRTGFVCEDEDAMVRAAAEIGRIDRRDCRTAAEKRFSDRAIVGEYEALYYEATGEG